MWIFFISVFVFAWFSAHAIFLSVVLIVVLFYFILSSCEGEGVATTSQRAAGKTSCSSTRYQPSLLTVCVFLWEGLLKTFVKECHSWANMNLWNFILKKPNIWLNSLERMMSNGKTRMQPGGAEVLFGDKWRLCEGLPVEFPLYLVL